MAQAEVSTDTIYPEVFSVTVQTRLELFAFLPLSSDKLCEPREKKKKALLVCRRCPRGQRLTPQIADEATAGGRVNVMWSEAYWCWLSASSIVR